MLRATIHRVKNFAVATTVAGLIWVLLHLPGALLVSAHLWRYRRDVFALPGWVPLADAWAYDVGVWSTAVLAGGLAGLVVRRPGAAALGVTIGVLLGGLRYPIGRALSGRWLYPADDLLVGLLISLLVGGGLAAVAALLGRLWWGRVLVLAAVLPCVLGLARLTDLLYQLTGRPAPIVPISAVVTPYLLAFTVFCAVAVTGSAWLGATPQGPPWATVLMIACLTGALLGGVGVLLALPDLAQALLPTELGGHSRPAQPEVWWFGSRLLAEHPVLLLVAAAAGIAAALGLRRVSAAPAPESSTPGSPFSAAPPPAPPGWG